MLGDGRWREGERKIRGEKKVQRKKVKQDEERGREVTKKNLFKKKSGLLLKLKEFIEIV